MASSSNDNNKRPHSDDSNEPGNSNSDDSNKRPKHQGDTCTPPENVNEIRTEYLREQQSTGISHIQPNEAGTKSRVTYIRPRPRRLDFPLKRDIHIDLVVEKGEYNLKLTSVEADIKMKKHAHNAAMLMSQGEFLCKLGKKLLSELGEHNESETYRTLNL